MNIMALVGKLGHALVSWGLGGPGESTPPVGAVCASVNVQAPSYYEVRVSAPTYLDVTVDGKC
jgi:hypothetical protein